MSTSLFLAKKIFYFRKKVSLIIVLIIAGACALYIFSDSLVNGLIKATLSSTLGIAIPHLQIEPMKYELIRNTSLILDVIKGVKGVISFSPRVYSYGILHINDHTVPANIVGVYYGYEKQFMLQEKYLTSSINDLSSNTIVVGKGIADRYNIGVGDEVTIVFSNGLIERYKIVSLLKTGFSNIDDSIIIINIDELRRMLGMGNDECSVIIIKVEDPYKVGDVASIIENRLSEKGIMNDLVIRTWKDLGKNILDLIDTEKEYTAILLGAIAVVVGLSIMNVMVLVTESMKRQIGVLKAIGMKSSGVFSVFFALALMYAIAGYLIGVVIAWLTSSTIGTISFSLGGASYTIRPVYYPSTFIYSLIYVILVSTISCSLSAYKASTIRPAEVMRFG